MNIRRLFVAEGELPPPVPGKAVAAGAQNPGSVGVFITPQSLSSFPVASFVVAMVWLLCQKLFPAWGQSLWVVILSAFLVGGAIFLFSVSVEDLKPRNTRAWILATVVGFINCLLLACSALGILNIPGELAGS